MDDWTPKVEQDNTLGSPEEFDVTWPYNFKWGFDAQTQQAHVWRVQGGTDGRPVHRMELQQTWGRQPRVQDGDALGLAKFIPAEKKLDGTVVAPATVLIQAYYKQDVPQQVFNWFEDHFPGCVARRAKLAAWEKQAVEEFDWSIMPDPDAGEEEITKWAYGDPEGLLMWDTDASQLPTHDQAATQSWGRKLQHGKDYWGYAVPAGDHIEVETGRFDTPLKVLQEVKGELAKKFPDQQIVLPTTREDHEELGVEFMHNDPKMHVDHAVSASWAQDHLGLAPRHPLDGPVTASKSFPGHNQVVAPDSYFRSLQRFLAKNVFPTSRKVAGADMDGAMIAVFLPKDVGDKLKIDGGEPVSNMHITLVYFTDKAADRDDWDEIERITEQYAQKYPVLKGEIGGYGVFSNEEPVLWASPSVPQLAELRHELAEACREAGFNVSDEHGWAPHITLAYDWDDDLPKLDDKIPVTFKTLRFARGNDGTDYKFTGALSKTAQDDWGTADFEAADKWTGRWKDGVSMPFGPQTWSGWKDAHRFVTNGSNVVTEPEENLRWQGKGWHGHGHPHLEEDFENRFPSKDGEKQDLLGGWAVPTIDNGGYGAYLWNQGEKMPEALQALQKELGKPVHLTDFESLRDPKLYQHYPEGGHYTGFPG